MTPVAITGFNRDVVIENTAPGPPFTNVALELNPGEGTAFYQSGLPGKSYGLPVSGAFTNATDGSAFQFQSYTANNALVLSSDTGVSSGTLTLATPTTYSRIAVIANSGTGNSTGTASLTLQFNDGTTFVTNYYAPDWFNNNSGQLYSVALQGVERINLSSGNTSGNPGNPRFYQTTLNLFAVLGATNKPISSITFGQATGNGGGGLAKSTGIYAVSGLRTSDVTPPTVATQPATSIQAKTATFNGQVTSTGGETPTVTLYYGHTDGGINPASWTQSITLGYQGGSFTQAVAGLLPNTIYYFTARAVNAAGTVWATPSKSFTTTPLTPPTMGNLPATSITAGTAAINGQVVSTGGEDPQVTFYYGPTDGGINAAAWSNSAALGVEAGTFSQIIFGLSPSKTYYFTTKGVNSAGAAWAASSQPFTTLATNPPPAAILTQHNDNSRSGENLNEGLLNINNVNTNTFGLIYTRAVDDQIYAQPLVVTNVNIPGKGVHNIVYIATVNDSVYAFDADAPTVVSAYWQTNFLGTFGGTNVVAPRNTDMTGACGGNYQDFSGAFGIVGTPVIDPSTKTMYLVARTKETTASATNFVQRLYALDIATGTNRLAPVIIAGSFGGVTFDPQHNNQRAALTLANGNIFIAWSSHCDWQPYHGWVMAYNAATLTQVAAYCDTPTGTEGGIWMSGQGPAADPAGNIYISTGNGTVGTSSNPSDSTNRAMSFLKLNGANLSIMSWFTPYNWSYLNGGDWDLGAGGVMLIPGTTLAIGGGKSSGSVSAHLYVVNRDSMGNLSGSSSADTNIVQSIPVTPTGIGVNHIHGAPVWWDGPDGSYTYVWGESDHLHQYKFDPVNGVFLLPAYAQSPTPAWVNGMTGGMLAISANGTNAGTGILWASHQYNGDANQNVRPGILHAYNAQNVADELWNSEQYSARDSAGKYAKFVPPTIANSKVYLATFSNRLNVYGLLPPGPPLIYQQPQSTTRFAGDPVTLSVAAGGGAPLSYQWKFNGTNVIPGATNWSYTLGSAPFTSAGTYSCTITNSLGSTNTTGALLTIVPAPTISYAQVVMADNPMAYWRLDDTGTVAHDSWGGHDGQYFNVNLGVAGYNPNDPDTAAGFGTLATNNSYVGNIQGIDFSTFANNATFSVEAWVNGEGNTQTSGAGIVTYGYGSGGEQFNLDTGGGSGNFRFSVRDAINVAHNANGTIAPGNTWRHVVGVCDEPNGLLHLYINGVDNADAAISGGVQMGTSPISIGARQAGFNSTYTLNFTGAIDEVAIYPYALSPTQVQAHYLAGTNPVVTLYIQQVGANALLTWSPGTLQSATNVIGPYTDIIGATPPYVAPPSGTRTFYRVRVK